MARIFTALIVTILCGCGALVPEKRSRSQAFDSSEHLHTKNALSISKALESTPILPVRREKTLEPAKPKGTEGRTIPFDENLWAWPAVTKETIKITDHSETGAGSNEAATGLSETKIPLGVGLILTAIGILALLFAWSMVRRSSAAVSAASDTADEFMAAAIRRFRERAQHTIEPHELAKLNTDIASLEADRGRLSKS